jgi:ribulose-5-phosphate 4-epimerase/fuculose-1-phosphate aldolase
MAGFGPAVGPAAGTSPAAKGDQRDELVSFARQMLADGLVEGMSGDLSVRTGGTMRSAVPIGAPGTPYAMADLGGPVRVVPCARFGTRGLADAAVAGLAGRTAVILRNHGAVAYGATLAQAYSRARTLEWLARAYWHARALAVPSTLTPAQLDEVAAAARSLRYGEANPPC